MWSDLGSVEVLLIAKVLLTNTLFDLGISQQIP